MSDATEGPVSPVPAQSRSVRFRLLAIALLPTLVILPLLLGVTIVRWNSKFDAALISKVNGDLTIAHQYLARILEKTGVQLRAIGLSAEFRDLVQAGSGTTLPKFLDDSRTTLGLDFLYIADGDGTIFASAPPIAAPTIRTDWPVTASALAGLPLTAIDIFANTDLAAIDARLADRARLELVATPNAVPTDRSTE